MRKVTAIMPAYNHESFIGESIESILSQTYTDIEILILNDGSTDGTKSVIEKYAEKDSRIRFLDKPNNERTVAALNDLIEEATGEYIMWLSSDDSWYPYTVEKLMERAALCPECGLIFGGCQYIGEKGEDRDRFILGEYTDKYQMHKMLLRGNIVLGCSTAVKKESYIKAGGFDARFRYAHDYNMWLKLFADTDVSYIRELLYKNRVHEGQVTSLGRNEADAVWVRFDAYANEAFMRRYLDRIGIKYSGETIVCLIKQMASSLIGSRLKYEKGAFIYRLDKYIRHSGVSEDHKEILLKEKEFFKLITDESFVSRIKITKGDIENAFQKLAEKTGLDGILINPEAVRYHLLDEDDPESFFKKVMPHGNMLCTANISAEDLAALKKSLIFYAKNDDKKDLYKIGVTSHMADNAPYRGSFSGLETLIHITLSGELYRIILEGSIKNE